MQIGEIPDNIIAWTRENNRFQSRRSYFCEGLQLFNTRRVQCIGMLCSLLKSRKVNQHPSI